MPNPLLPCTVCGAPFERTGNPVWDKLCLSCFKARVEVFCDRIAEAGRVGPGTLTAVYLTGMLDLGADAQETRADIVHADLQ